MPCIRVPRRQILYLWPLKTTRGEEVLEYVRRLTMLDPQTRKLWHDPGGEFNNNFFAEYLKSQNLVEIQTPTA